MMLVQLTRQFKIIKPNKNKARSLGLTMRRYKQCINFHLHHIARGRLMKDIYNEAKSLYGLQNGLVQTARDIAKEQYKSYKNNPSNHRFPHFRGSTPVRYDNRSISFQETDGHFKLWANISTVDGRVHVPITSCDENIKELLNKRFKSVQLLFKDGGFHLHIIFEYERDIPREGEFEHFIGVDRGSHNNFATVVVQNRDGNVLESRFYSAKPMLEKRRRFHKRRKVLGERRLLKEIRRSRGREENYIEDKLHKISTDIVRIANEYPNSVIVLENLKDIREGVKWSKCGNRTLHAWPFKKFEDMIEYKAHGNSIAIRRVLPRGTSSVCRNCFGEIRRRPSIRAVCTVCKKMYNADWLGAVNIVRRLFYYMLDNLGHSESGPGQDDEESVVEGTAPGIDQCLVARLPMS